MKRVLFVCTGNICRSPALEKMFKHLVGDKFDVESAGISSSFHGAPMDDRMAAELKKRGYDTSHTAQMLNFDALQDFDYVFVATQDMKDMLPGDNVYLATHFSKKFKDQDIPDPYLTGGFGESVDMLEEVCKSIEENI